MIMQKTRKGSDEDAAAKMKKPIARMLRGPLLATRHVHLDLCTPEVRLLVDHVYSLRGISD